jgi:Domain of unknown function (DUF1707)
MTYDLPDRPADPAPPAAAGPMEMRASDADRERVAEVLRAAAGDGRLNLEELEERLHAAYTARTYAQLEPLTRDLPGVADHHVPVAAPDPRIVGGTPTSRGGVAIMSEFKRRGQWVAPGRFTGFAFWGGGTVDLREARFAEAEIHIRAFAIMGGIDVIVPEDVDVVVRGLGIMGSFDDNATGPGAPGAPRVVVGGFSFWGGVNVKRKARKESRKRDKSDGHC